MIPEHFSDAYVPEPNSGCWLWIRSTNINGYGQAYVNKAKLMAHRYAWQLFKGEIPKGIQVLHSCDTPSCVNPEHLYLGTHHDNMRDRKEKGRYRTVPCEICSTPTHSTGTKRCDPCWELETRITYDNGQRLQKVMNFLKYKPTTAQQ